MDQSDIFEGLGAAYALISTRYFLAGERAGRILSEQGFKIEHIEADGEFQGNGQLSLLHVVDVVVDPNDHSTMPVSEFSGGIVMNMESDRFADRPYSQRVEVESLMNGIASGLRGNDSSDKFFRR